jgi:ketopantoate reductase
MLRDRLDGTDREISGRVRRGPGRRRLSGSRPRVEHLTVLRARFPAAQVVAGAIRVESTWVAAGRIQHTSPFSPIEGASDTAPRERVDALAAQLRQAGLDVTVRDGETALLWDKLAFLAPLARWRCSRRTPVRRRNRSQAAATRPGNGDR